MIYLIGQPSGVFNIFSDDDKRVAAPDLSHSEAEWVVG